VWGERIGKVMPSFEERLIIRAIEALERLAKAQERIALAAEEANKL